MFIRFHERMKEQEEGFTLIELLVVILIIAILAAIAIPVFLNQRKKGWVAQMESALKNAATAQESYLVGNNTYASTEANLVSEGWKKASSVSVQASGITISSGNAYCVSVYHTTLEDEAIEPMAISSEVTTPTKDRACEANGVMGTAAATSTG